MKKWIALITAVFFPQVLWAADVPATLQWSQRVELSTPVSGVVKAVNVEVGDLVKKGQVLLSLDNTSYQASVAEIQSRITRLDAEAEEAKRDLDRAQELYERTIVSTTDLDQARLRRVKSLSMLAEARARLRQDQKALEETSLRAPGRAGPERGQRTAATDAADGGQIGRNDCAHAPPLPANRQSENRPDGNRERRRNKLHRQNQNTGAGTYPNQGGGGLPCRCGLHNQTALTRRITGTGKAALIAYFSTPEISIRYRCNPAP